MDRRAVIARLVCIILLPLATCSARSTAQEPQPADVVQKLYHEVVTRHPLGVPTGAARTAIWPLLSKRLIKAFETRNACDRDWDRQHPNANVPPFILKHPGFYEDGLFSGSDEMGYLDGASVGRTIMQRDGSYLVYVNVWSYFDSGLAELRTSKKYHWQVGTRVVSEDGRFFVDDIRFFKNAQFNQSSIWMSKMITAGCNGPHSISDPPSAP
jgi:hypothetical protein